MKKHAILCGSATDGFTQKKITEMHDFLTRGAGGSWSEKEITIFPNGVSEVMLSFLHERLKADKTERIFLYICTMSSVRNEDKSIWLGGEEVQKSVIEAFCVDGGTQVIYECGREVVSEEVFENA